MLTKLKTYPAYIIMAVVIILDQATKILVRKLIPENSWISVGKDLFGEVFRLHHLANDGAAFSLSLPNPMWNRFFFVGTTVLALIFILWLLYHANHKIQVVAFGMVMGGAIGNNLIDRVLFGAVTDFVDVDIPNLISSMPRFPVFNVADSSIFIAMCLLIFDMIFIKDKKETADEIQPQPIDSN